MDEELRDHHPEDPFEADAGRPPAVGTDPSGGRRHADMEEPDLSGVIIRDLLGSHSEQTGAYFD